MAISNLQPERFFNQVQRSETSREKIRKSSSVVAQAVTSGEAFRLGSRMARRASSLYLEDADGWRSLFNFCLNVVGHQRV